MDKAEQKYIRLTTYPIPKLLLMLSAPAIVSMLITAVYNAADSYFVSAIDDSAVGSIGVIFSYMAIIQAVGFLFGHGSGNFMSRKIGEKHYGDAGEIAVTAMVLSFSTGLVLAVFGLIFIDELAMFLGSTQTILPYAVKYLRYILLASPFQTAALTLNNQLRFQGNAKHGMLGLGFGAILNMALDPILITKFGLGVDGAGIATMVSQVLGFFILFICTFKGGNMPMKLKLFRLTKAYIKEIFKGGIPSFGRQVIGSVATILLNYALKPYGDAPIAAMTVVSKVGMVLLSVIIGLGQGFQPICGVNYGAGKKNRVLEAFKDTVLISYAIMIIGSVIGFIFATPIAGFFVSEAESVRIGAIALRYQTVPACLCAFYQIGSMMLQNLGKSLKATVLAVSRQGIIFIPLILILPGCFGLTGALLTQPISDLISFAIAVPLLIPELKQLMKSANESA